jgi:SAM-dependent methyltransferase
MSLLTKVRKGLRRSWMRYALRGVGANDNYQRLDLAYQIADPWNMQSDLETFRFERTNAVIRQYCTGLRSILEVGCGEGHQSQFLQQLAPQIHGVDVSATAIERAKRRLPTAHFAAGDIFSQPWSNTKFDLVVACEVLYYIENMQRTIAEMSRLGDACLVTIFAPAIGRVGPLLESIPNVRKDWFGRREAQWVTAFWTNPRP